MSRAVLRFLVAIAAAACAWLVAIPAAWAGMQAPQCDHRGAITFAPPPQLQPIEQSIDMTDDEMTCVEKMLVAEGVHQGNQPPPSQSTTEPLTAPVTTMPPVLAPYALLPRADIDARAPSGVRRSLDRPPRH